MSSVVPTDVVLCVCLQFVTIHLSRVKLRFKVIGQKGEVKGSLCERLSCQERYAYADRPIINKPLDNVIEVMSAI